MFSIIIPNYNGINLLKECLKSIPQTFELILIDNGSADGSLNYLKSLKEKRKNTKVVFNKRNLGFAKAINQGALLAKSEYLVILNNDIQLASNWFSLMEGAIKEWQAKDKIGSYFGKVLDRKGERIESTGLRFWIKGKALNRGNGERNSKDKYNKEEIVFGGSASAVVYKKEAFFEVGMFDEQFFAYEEDVDLALRMNGAGWKTLYVPRAVSHHLGGETSKRMGNLRQRLDIVNWWLIIAKNYPLSVIVKNLPALLIERGRNLSGLIKSSSWQSFAFDFFRTCGRLMVKLPLAFIKRKPLSFLNQYE